MMTKTQRSFRHSALVLVATSCMALQACSSSDSSSGPASDDGQTPTSFTPPVDAASLRTALITGDPGAATSHYWQCIPNLGDALLGYQLLSDSTGMETDLKQQNVQSSLTWQATSATTMSTLVSETGFQNDFTDITFSDATQFSLNGADNLILSCTLQSVTPEAPPTTDQSLAYGGVNYPLTHGFEEAYSYRPIQRDDTHSSTDFDVADAAFIQTILQPIGASPGQTLWRPHDASVWLRANLHAPEAIDYDTATFYFEPDTTEDNSAAVAGKYFFQEGRFGVDVNEDGSIETDDYEFYDVTAGSITITRNDDSVQMAFDLTLENGVSLSGSFTGVFPLFQH